MNELKTFHQTSAYVSPWSFQAKLGRLAWEIVWNVFCVWTPKPFNSWRLFWLKCFGAKIEGTPFVHQRARIEIPWHLILHDRSCIGDRANLYSLAEIEIGEEATIAQEVYLCGGTHDFTDPALLSLQVAKITVGPRAFICARAFILPGVVIGESAIVGACAVVTKDVAAKMVVAGSPAKEIGPRPSLCEKF